MLAFSGAGIVTLPFVCIFARRKPIRDNSVTVCRAIVAGMVCLASNANTYLPWSALVVGMLGALSYLIMANVFYRYQLDDPAEFFPMFGAAGWAGLICAAFFNTANGVFYDNSTKGEIIIDQCLGSLIIAGWAFFVALIATGFLRITKMLRIGLRCEIVGYDYIDAAEKLEYPADRTIFDLKSQKVE